MARLTVRRLIPPRVVIGVVLVAVAVCLVVAAARGGGALDMPTATLLGVVEGITEFLPVSSTGHLTVTQRLLDIRGTAADAYAVVIQAGAILAVLVVYRDRVVSVVAGLLGRDRAGRRLGINLVAAFVPAAVIGFAFGDVIKSRLFGVGPVAAAWAVGGVLILVAGRRLDRVGVESVGTGAAFVVGIAQVAALWPGVSRSLVTILVGVAVGFSLVAAVEFSFLLGVLTLGAATGLDAMKHGDDILSQYGLASPAIGFFVAFVSAVVAVRWLVAYLERGSIVVFGWYRLAVAALALVLLATGVV